MNTQLALIAVDPTPVLTERQQAVYTALTAAGHEGLDADQAGAIAHELKEGRWQHGRDERCNYCGREGQQILVRLREYGLARYRRRKGQLAGVWLTTGSAAAPPSRSFGDFPEGY